MQPHRPHYMEPRKWQTPLIVVSFSIAALLVLDTFITYYRNHREYRLIEMKEGKIMESKLETNKK